MFGNSNLFEIELIGLDLFEKELFQSKYLKNKPFGETIAKNLKHGA